MTTPGTPGEAIRDAAARHKASTDATKALARTLAEERAAPPEAQPPAEAAPTP